MDHHSNTLMPQFYSSKFPENPVRRSKREWPRDFLNVNRI